MKIAIQGHPTRGKEVIQILESLGGKNVFDQSGSNENFIYYIDNVGLIYSVLQSMCSSERRIYTLEEFEKEFPFKVGDEVMFPVTKGWLSGKIIGLDYAEDQLKYKIHDRIGGYSYVKPYKLSLYPMKKERNITLTLDKAKEWYKKGGELKEIALQAFSEKELNPLPRSWEEFCKNNPIQDHEAFINFTNGGIIVCKECAGSGLGTWMRKPEKDRCKCVSQKSAEAHLAMMQLEQLRDCWRQGWVQTPTDAGYRINKTLTDDYVVMSIGYCKYFLAFPTRKMAEEFLECFRDLIEKAGDLI